MENNEIKVGHTIINPSNGNKIKVHTIDKENRMYIGSRNGKNDLAIPFDKAQKYDVNEGVEMIENQERISCLISNIVSGDNIQAKEDFNFLIANKINEKLNSMKQDIVSDMFD